MSGTVNAIGRSAAPSAVDPQVERSKPDLRRFFLLVLQLSCFAAVFRFVDLGNPKFFIVTCLMVVGFCISYWLPFRLKERFFILFSLAGAYVLLDPVSATLLIAVGLGM